MRGTHRYTFSASPILSLDWPAAAVSWSTLARKLGDNIYWMHADDTVAPEFDAFAWLANLCRRLNFPRTARFFGCFARPRAPRGISWSLPYKDNGTCDWY